MPSTSTTPALQQPVPPEMEPPRELSMVSLPAYQVEPPDILMIEMLRHGPVAAVPHRHLRRAANPRRRRAAADQPTSTDSSSSKAKASSRLGRPTGGCDVAGMTVEQANEVITAKLKETFVKPEVSVQLAKTAGTAPVTGEYLVGPDGTVNLRQYGTLHVAGKSITEIRMELNKHLSQYFDSPDASVEVRQFNSKVFYVITEGGGMGDNIRRVPITGNDTVHGRLERGQRFVAGVQHDGLGGASGAGRFRLRADIAGRLRGDHARRLDGDELSDHAGRSRVCGRRQHDRGEQLADEDDGADREDAGHHLVEHVHRPKLARPSAANTTGCEAAR